MKSDKICAILFTALAIGGCRDAFADSTYGIEIGTPINLPECQAAMEPSKILRYTSLIESNKCFRWVDQGNIGKGTLDLSGPAWIHLGNGLIEPPAASRTFWVYIVNGAVEKLIIKTPGVDASDNLVDLLRAKFGTESTSRRETVQNGFGAQFTSIRLEWVRPTNLITYNSIDPETRRLDKGSLEIRSPQGDRAWSEYQARILQGLGGKIKF